MKTTHYLSSIFALIAASSAFAATTVIDSATTINASSDTSVTSITIAEGDDWQIVSGGSWYYNNNSNGFNFDLNIYGTIETSATGSSVIRIDSRGSSASPAVTNVNINGGSMINNSGGNTTYIFGQDDSSGLLNINLTNGAKIINNSGNLNLEIARNTNTTITVDATSSISASQMDYATRGNNTVNSGTGLKQVFNVNGGTVSLTGNLIIANAGQLSATSGVDANFNITSGGTVSLNSINMIYDAGPGKAGQPANKAYLTVKDAGSTLTVRNSLNLGVATAENPDTIAELILHTGSVTTVANATNLRAYGQIRAVLDSSNLSASQPLFTTNNLASVGTAFIVDGDLLASGGADITVALFKINGSISLDGVSYTLAQLAALDPLNSSDLDILSDFISFTNNTGNSYWEDFGYADLVFDTINKTVGLSLTSSLIPEPATYAAVFGAIAIALACYRRRRS